MKGRDIEIVVADDAEGAARIVAERLAEAARAGGHVVLTGGSTPKRAYELAAELEQDWSGVELWWGDARCVPPDDERSNYRMAKIALLDRVSGAPGVIHRMHGELDRDEGALAYEQELGSLQRFDPAAARDRATRCARRDRARAAAGRTVSASRAPARTRARPRRGRARRASGG